MPKEIDEFEDLQKRETTTSEKIIQLLITNQDKAYKRNEIAEKINEDKNTVRTNLSKLKEKGLLRHKKPYWTITQNKKRLYKALKTHYENEYLNEILGEENPEKWEQHKATRKEIQKARKELD